MTEQPTPTTPLQHPPDTRLIHWLFLVGVTIIAILADQITKAYVVAQLNLHESWMPLDFIEPLFRFTHVHNTGVAFGMFQGGGIVFIVIPIIVSAVIVFYYRELPAQAWLVRLALGLQMGGALGNLIDRLRHGYVVDFFNVEFWPVFNVADSCIVIGVALLAFEMLREEWQLARQRKAEQQSAAEGDASEASEEQTSYS
ncbi:MAG: signal peptidase II [Anaerolineae bacterium]|nr:signal peptidase II [Anaerolineae bacterium]